MYVMRKLVTFVQAARARGVVEVNAIGSTICRPGTRLRQASFLTAWEAEAVALPVLGGFQYCDYFYLERHFE